MLFTLVHNGHFQAHLSSWVPLCGFLLTKLIDPAQEQVISVASKPRDWSHLMVVSLPSGVGCTKIYLAMSSRLIFSLAFTPTLNYSLIIVAILRMRVYESMFSVSKRDG